MRERRPEIEAMWDEGVMVAILCTIYEFTMYDLAPLKAIETYN